MKGKKMSKNKNYHNYRVNGKFAKKPSTCECECCCSSQKDKENYICLVIDKSGSMSGLEEKVVQFVNKWLDDARNLSQQFNQKTFISIIEYSTRVNVVVDNIDINKYNKYFGYRTYDMTALFDGQKEAIDLLSRYDTKNNNKDRSFLVNHITDGHENSSRCNIRSVINEMCKKQLDNWTFTFLVPPGNKHYFVRSYGLEAGNVTEWETTQQGLYEAEEKTSEGLFQYYTSRGAGASAVKNFYDVKVDLSAITNLTKVAKQNHLQDLSKEYDKFGVSSEQEIRDYVEKNLNKRYIKGNCYYQLSKPETVQPSKEVLVMEKGKGSIYGGTEARNLIGLPDNAYAKVDPYNLSKYNVFVQSTSVNRKLVRGTDILIKK